MTNDSAKIACSSSTASSRFVGTRPQSICTRAPSGCALMKRSASKHTVAVSFVVSISCRLVTLM